MTAELLRAILSDVTLAVDAAFHDLANPSFANAPPLGDVVADIIAAVQDAANLPTGEMPAIFGLYFQERPLDIPSPDQEVVNALKDAIWAHCAPKVPPVPPPTVPAYNAEFCAGCVDEETCRAVPPAKCPGKQAKPKGKRGGITAR